MGKHRSVILKLLQYLGPASRIVSDELAFPVILSLRLYGLVDVAGSRGGKPSWAGRGSVRRRRVSAGTPAVGREDAVMAEAGPRLRVSQGRPCRRCVWGHPSSHTGPPGSQFQPHGGPLGSPWKCCHLAHSDEEDLTATRRACPGPCVGTVVSHLGSPW